MNVDVSLTLFDLIRSENYQAGDHETRSLPLGLGRVAKIDLNVYLVKDDQIIFQFPYPRRDRLDQKTLNLMMSMIYHSYAIDDFADGIVSVADLSCDQFTYRPKDERYKIRAPRLVFQEKRDIISLEDMADDIQSIQTLLLELSEEPSG